MSKLATLLLIAALTASLIMIKVAPASAYKPPSIPEFTAKIVDNSYDVPPTSTSTTDPYTNKTTTTTTPGYRVISYSIKVTIENQPFPATVDGYNSSIYFNIRTKPHFGSQWTEHYPLSYSDNPPSGIPRDSPTSMYLNNPTSIQSNSTYTVLSFPIYAQEGQIDIQVKAMLGRDSHTWFYQPPNNYYNISEGYFKSPAVAFLIDSGWSETQTLTIETQTPTPEPVTPVLTVVIVAVVVGTSFGLLVYFTKRKR